VWTLRVQKPVIKTEYLRLLSSVVMKKGPLKLKLTDANGLKELSESKDLK